MRFCDHVVTVHEPYRQLALERGARAQDLSIFMNFPDPRLFDRTKYPHRPPLPDRFVLMYHGTVAPRFDLDTVLEAIPLIQADIPGLEVRILGEGNALDVLRTRARHLGIDHLVALPGAVPLSEIPGRIVDADLGLAPVKPDKLQDLSLSTKLLEYLMLGTPVIAARRSVTAQYLSDHEVLFYESADAEGLARQILYLYRNPSERQRRAEAGIAFMQRYTWTETTREYLQVMQRLARPGG